VQLFQAASSVVIGVLSLLSIFPPLRRDLFRRFFYVTLVSTALCLYNFRDEVHDYGRLMDRLAELRERRALTLRELAEMSGVAADTINQIELGHRKPRPSTLRKLARALEVDVEELVPPKDAAPHPSPPETTAQEERRRKLSLEDIRALLAERVGHAWLALPDKQWDAWWKGVPREEVANRYLQIREEWGLVMPEFDALGKGEPTPLPRGRNITDVYSKLLARRLEARFLVPQSEESDREFQKRRLDSRHFRTFTEELRQEQQEADNREKRVGA
jgi:transcriptional regulator with XRE-family HTH domain